MKRMMRDLLHNKSLDEVQKMTRPSLFFMRIFLSTKVYPNPAQDEVRFSPPHF